MTFRDCQCERADCPQCGPLVRLAEEIRLEFEQTKSEARIPTAEIVWWRAQMRAREDAARKAARPILFTQALAIAALVGLLISLAGRLTLPMLVFAETPTFSMALPHLRLAIAAACCLVLAPVALYFALSRE
jgi:hypothetical protein